MKLIGTNHGIEATRKKLGETDPQAAVGLNRLMGTPDKVYPTEPMPSEGTLMKLVANNNELVGKVLPDIDARLAALEVAGPTAPFPASG